MVQTPQTAPASSGPNFRTDGDDFNFIFLAGQQNPGIAKVTLSKKHDWTKKKSKGATGGTLTYTGDSLVEFSVEYYLWETADFDAWPGWAAMQRKTLKVSGSNGSSGALVTSGVVTNLGAVTAGISTGPTTQPVAMDVYHPDLAEINVLRCVVEEEGGPVNDGKGGRRYTWKYVEYNPPKPAGGTANASTTAGPTGNGAEQPAQTAADQMIANLLAKAQALTKP